MVERWEEGEGQEVSPQDVGSAVREECLEHGAVVAKNEWRGWEYVEAGGDKAKKVLP